MKDPFSYKKPRSNLKKKACPSKEPDKPAGGLHSSFVLKVTMDT